MGPERRIGKGEVGTGGPASGERGRVGRIESGLVLSFSGFFSFSFLGREVRGGKWGKEGMRGGNRS